MLFGFLLFVLVFVLSLVFVFNLVKVFCWLWGFICYFFVSVISVWLLLWGRFSGFVVVGVVVVCGLVGIWVLLKFLSFDCAVHFFSFAFLIAVGFLGFRICFFVVVYPLCGDAQFWISFCCCYCFTLLSFLGVVFMGLMGMFACILVFRLFFLNNF